MPLKRKRASNELSDQEQPAPSTWYCQEDPPVPRLRQLCPCLSPGSPAFQWNLVCASSCPAVHLSTECDPVKAGLHETVEKRKRKIVTSNACLDVGEASRSFVPAGEDFVSWMQTSRIGTITTAPKSRSERRSHLVLRHPYTLPLHLRLVHAIQFTYGVDAFHCEPSSPDLARSFLDSVHPALLIEGLRELSHSSGDTSADLRRPACAPLRVNGQRLPAHVEDSSVDVDCGDVFRDALAFRPNSIPASASASTGTKPACAGLDTISVVDHHGQEERRRTMTAHGYSRRALRPADVAMDAPPGLETAGSPLPEGGGAPRSPHGRGLCAHCDVVRACGRAGTPRARALLTRDDDRTELRRHHSRTTTQRVVGVGRMALGMVEGDSTIVLVDYLLASPVSEPREGVTRDRLLAINLPLVGSSAPGSLFGFLVPKHTFPRAPSTTSYLSPDLVLAARLRLTRLTLSPTPRPARAELGGNVALVEPRYAEGLRSGLTGTSEASGTAPAHLIDSFPAYDLPSPRPLGC
ncbi:hypothetical protein C8R46DRAFT_1209600 [Mycena filopes]|nr:hypothetical protein C8R46DRAFT_1209600 [Mycena filopes]